MKKLSLVILLAFALPFISMNLKAEEPQTIDVMGVRTMYQIGTWWFIICEPPMNVICFKIILEETVQITINGQDGPITKNVDADYSVSIDENGNPIYTFELIE